MISLLLKLLKLDSAPKRLAVVAPLFVVTITALFFGYDLVKRDDATPAQLELDTTVVRPDNPSNGLKGFLLKHIPWRNSDGKSTFKGTNCVQEDQCGKIPNEKGSSH
jgi:hypothetical protein